MLNNLKKIFYRDCKITKTTAHFRNNLSQKFLTTAESSADAVINI